MNRNILIVQLVLALCFKTASACNQNQYLWYGDCFPCGGDCSGCQDGYGCNYCPCHYYSYSDDTSCACYTYGFRPPNDFVLGLSLGLGLGLPIVILIIVTACKRCREEPNPGPMAQPPNQSILRLDQQPSQWKPIDREFNQQTCPICQNTLGNVFTSCNHCFHFQCIKAWAQKNKTCPMCRKEVEDKCTIICGVCQTKCSDIKLTQNINLSALFGICETCLQGG